MKNVLTILVAILLTCLVVASPASCGEFANVSIRLINSGELVRLPVPVSTRNSYVGIPLVQRYVEFPQRGQEFEILVTPKTVPLGIVVAVDGHNVLSGYRVTAYESKVGMGLGFVLEERRTYRITGWRETSQDVRRFRVDDQWKSVATTFGQGGDLSQAGTIVIAAFLPVSRRGVVGNLGTSAGTRIREPVRYARFHSAPTASELFALRYLPLSRRIGKDNQFIGQLPD